jgi:hypothetical protein
MKREEEIGKGRLEEKREEKHSFKFKLHSTWVN